MMHSAKQHPPFPSPSPTLSILFPFGPAATINSTNDLPHRGQGSIKNAHSLGHTASRGRPEAGREATPEPSCTFTLPDCKPSRVEVRKNHTFKPPPPPRDVLISVCVCVCAWAGEIKEDSVSHMWWVYYQQPSQCRGPDGVWDVSGIQTKQKTLHKWMERRGSRKSGYSETKIDAANGQRWTKR